MYEKVLVSDDVLLLVEDLLEHRYPKQSEQAILRAQQGGRAVGQAINDIHLYDDFVIQLDDWLRTKYGDDNSIGIQAAHFINRIQGRSFFHCNRAVLRNLLTYQKSLQDEYDGAEERFEKEGMTSETIAFNLNNHRQRLKVFDEAPASIWNFLKLPELFPFTEEIPNAGYLTENFIYPGVYKVYST